MYRTNFYGQAALNSHLSLNQHLFNNFENIPSNFEPLANDSFGRSTPDSFEKMLHAQIISINKDERALNHKLQNLTIDNLNTEQKDQLSREYTALQNAKKMLEIIVENMQKCAANIASNFR